MAMKKVKKGGQGSKYIRGESPTGPQPKNPFGQGRKKTRKGK